MSARPVTKYLDELQDVDVDTTPPGDGDALTYDLANDVWVPGTGASSFLSDADPAGLGPVDPGTSSQASRDDHVHPLGPWDTFVMRSPDGTLWDMAVDNTGAWTSTSFTERITEAGDIRITEGGVIRSLES